MAVVVPGGVPEGRFPARIARVPGGDLWVDLADPVHIACQGQTRSGKSVLSYTLLGGLLAYSPALVVAGVDPTAILLSPFAGSPGEEWRHLRNRDLPRSVAVVEALVAEMERRLDLILEWGQDKIETWQYSEQLPCIVVVLEELPGWIEALTDDDAAEARKASDRLAPKAQRAVKRLLRESLKCGIRLLILAQRFDASLLGGDARSNLSYRITLRVDNADAVRMLHPNVKPEVAERVELFGQGRAVYQGPGEPLTEMQADFRSYEQYRAEVREAAAQHLDRMTDTDGWPS